ncbi:MAG: putative ABC transporter permease [Bacilli bacterium]|nr:putative ABC transporter permease [Bacilli bacterium]
MYYINTFFVFSILGHIIENFVYKNVDSGILFGLWTPIYGLGVILIILIHNTLKKIKINKCLYPFILFVVSAILLSTLEYIGGILIEKLFGRIFWNYSNQQFNIGKYTSLRMSLIWGISSILVVYILKPILNKVIKKIPKFITYILVFLFIIDLIFTFINLGDSLS